MEQFPIIKKLGGPAAVRRLLSDYFGRELHRNTVGNWQARGFIPLKNWAPLAQIAQTKGIKTDLFADFGPAEPEPQRKVRDCGEKAPA